MNFLDTLKARRSFYQLGKKAAYDKNTLAEGIQEVLELTPDAFNMQSVRTLILFEEKSEAFWDKVNQTFDNNLDEFKFKGFRGANGTILFFTEEKTVNELAEAYPLYKDNFPIFASHAMGMAQINVWNYLRTQDFGASLQHYNPVIDEWVKNDYDLPKTWKLTAQMPFGEILAEEAKKEKLPRKERTKVL